MGNFKQTSNFVVQAILVKLLNKKPDMFVHTCILTRPFSTGVDRDDIPPLATV